MDFVIDYVTGKAFVKTPKEEVRQNVEKFLVEEKGYPKDCILVDYVFEVEIDNKMFFANIDILVKIDGKNFLNIECAPPTVLASLERKALASSRILNIAYTIVTDWEQTKIFESLSGKVVGRDIRDIPDFNEAKKIRFQSLKLDEERLKKEKRILFAYMGILHCKCEFFECSKD